MEHTGTEVRIAAMGPQAANVAGVTDQTDLFR
jgi:alkaline phosphatase